jgi:REP element-mobilizing transposase RayT
MPNYRRAYAAGGTWFFTVSLLQRRDNDLLIREIDTLRLAVKRVMYLHPWHIDAWLYCRNICIVCGHFPMAIPTIRFVGVQSKRSFAVLCLYMNDEIRRVCCGVNAVYGKGGIGNIKYVMKRISTAISIIATSTP